MLPRALDRPDDESSELERPPLADPDVIEASSSSPRSHFSLPRPILSSAPSFPSRRLSTFIPSSPLSTASSATRGRQSSTSSNVSSATETEASSVDDGGGDECFSARESGLGPSGAIISGGGASPPPAGLSVTTAASGAGAGPRRASVQQGLYSTGLSVQDLYSSPPPLSPVHSPTQISSPASLPISISVATSLAPASVRLSTTPHFPSPLAQASGPEEDLDQSKGEDGDGESEDDGKEYHLWGKRDGSPSTRGDSGMFGDIDLSPVPNTVGLPDVNALGLESQRTPRPVLRASHRHTAHSGRDSSPEVDPGRTARANRVRSVGRASGGSEDASGSSPRRRSRTTADILPTSGPSSFYSNPATMSMPSSPTTSTSSISRRTSINLVSPPRVFGPSSPTLSRPSRSSVSSSVSTSMAMAMPIPFPAPPPPSESIKLQKVPEFVRSAIDFRQPGGHSFLGETFGSPSSETPVPKTPSATRASSPVSVSGSGSGSGSLASDTIRSPPGSQPVSRLPSRGPSRRGSRERLLTTPLAIAINPSTPTPAFVSSPSAFAPVVPFPSTGPPMADGRAGHRDRARSVYLPSTKALLLGHELSGGFTASPPGVHDLGVSPLSQGISPFNTAASLSTSPSSSASFSTAPFSFHKSSMFISQQRQGQGLLESHRTSIAPSAMPDASENTDEYAQIILASRSAKMRKWKTSTSTIGTVGFDLALNGLSNDSFLRKPIPAFDEAAGGEPMVADITSGDGAGFGVAGYSKEIEWVDWLDEYRKMKEAKMRAEQLDHEREPEHEPEGEPARPAEDKGKGKASLDLSEYNPFEATTADLNFRRTTGFLPPEPPVQYFPLLHPTVFATPGDPRPQTSAILDPPPASAPLEPIHHLPLARTLSDAASSSAATGHSPGSKRKKNFKLGTKIDAWWSAVRTSFSAGTPDEERGSSSRRPSETNVTAVPRHALTRTSSQFARPSTPQSPGHALRNAASAHDLTRTRDHASISDPPQFVPIGALAPVSRAAAPLQPPATPFGKSSGSDSDGGGTAKPDTRRRNPHLSLNLGPSFNAMLASKDHPRGATGPAPQPVTDSSGSGSGSGIQAPSFFSPPRGPTTQPQQIASGLPTSTPGLTPGHPPMWDQTPGLVPVSSGLTAVAVRPEALKDATASANADFSMHTIRQQIRLRLVTAKENCDKELRKIIQGITAHVETEIHQRPEPLEGHEQFGDLESDYGGYVPVDFDSESEALADVDGEYEAPDSDGGTSRASSSRAHAIPSPSFSRPAVLVRRKSINPVFRSDSPRRQSLVAPRNHHQRSRRPDLAAQAKGEKQPPRSGGSANSSRSNSRSRSPLPPQVRNFSNGSGSPAHSSRSDLVYGVDLAHSAFIVLLQDIITVATEILDTPILTLTARPGSCADYIQRVQRIGKAWDENPELACRGWYVQLLLAVAGLSRVAEWWELERGFWTFDDADEEDAEPILFVAKHESDVLDSLDFRGPGQTFSPSAEYALDHSAHRHGETTYSPLGIDLGVRDHDDSTGAQAPSQSLASPTTAEDATKRDAEDLRQAVDEVRSQTLLMELSLDGQLFQYLSSAWEELVGLMPEDCLDTPISNFLYPEDAAVFAEATRQLEADDSHTVEVSFRLHVASSSASSNDDEPPEDLYEVMEGKGMLMLDGLTGGPSHTMWVVRPAPLSLGKPGVVQDEPLARFGLHRRASSDPNAPFHATNRLASEPILCRICERATPAWFFEKHNETCNETHRLESDITECNDRLKELIAAVDEIAGALEHVDATSPAEYRGIPLLTPPPVPTPPSYLEGLRPPLSIRPQAFQVRKNQNRVLDQVAEILQTALTISTPSVLDETGDLPIEDQRLLSPISENKLALVMRWQRPVAEEPALARLVADTEEQTRFKLNSVNRLRNTILYAEKVRQEWEEKAAAALGPVRDDHQWENESALFDSPKLQPFTSDEFPRADGPDLAGSSMAPLQRQSSHLFGLTSPLLPPSDNSKALLSSPGGLNLALSPRIPSGVPSSRTRASSIKDFTILKPISKGAFGSVYLAKKITTGDYYAIKVLKKSDMIAKNQVTNVKAERMILMTQSESDFVVKLYYTFQSKDYLYLVMEYLNGGDCAALVKNMGELPEDWARKYIAEVVVGLEYLHASGIVHRDLKPDNLLIDAKGHLKLTDFGLSRIGLLGRQTRMPTARDHRRAFDSSWRSPSKDPNTSNGSSPSSTPANALGASQASYFGSLTVSDGFWLDHSESSGSGSPAHSALHRSGGGPTLDSPAPVTASDSVPAQGKFVGTPDYLAPESILGVGMDARVDWWALGVICYEFLYGIPPFSDQTPEKVFENILSRRIDWHEAEVEISPEAHDFMDRLLSWDSKVRLGAGGADEVKAHPFLAGIDWSNLLAGEVDFVPKISDPESTDYFDPRGATAQVFSDDGEDDGDVDADVPELVSSPPAASTSSSASRILDSSSMSFPVRRPRERSETEPSPHDDFGTFSFRNLPVLKQANDDVIRQMRDQQLLPPLSFPGDSAARPTSFASKPAKSRPGSVDFRIPQSIPSTPSSTSSGSNPSRPSAPPTTAGSTASGSHSRRPSEQHAVVDRLRPRQSSVNVSVGESAGEHARRNSLPSSLRSMSLTDYDRPPVPDGWGRRRTSAHTPPSSLLSSPVETHEPIPLPPLAIPEREPPTEAQSVPIPAPSSAPVAALAPVPTGRTSTIDCLIAGRNPISNKVLETMLVRLGCRCVVVPNGAEAILAAGGVKFDIIWMDLQMPVVDGDKAARMIKSTKNPSSSCPIIAVCSYGTGIDDELGTLFSGVLPKPILKAQVLTVFAKLGFSRKARRGSAEVGEEHRRRGSGGSRVPPPITASEDRRGSA